MRTIGLVTRIIGIAIVTLVISIVLVRWLLTPRVDLPTFAQVEQRLPEMAELARAHREGRLVEDPVRGELRRAVYLAYERLELTPCDEGLRQDFVAAVIPFIEAVHKSEGDAPVETYQGESGVLNATEFLDREVLNKILWAALDGLLSHKELPPYAPYVIGPMPSQFKGAVAKMRETFPHGGCR